MLTIGSEAPDVQIELHTGKTVRLSDYRGKKHVVLYFYPKDFTLGCTKQACSFSDHVEQIRSLGAVIIGMSADSIDSHRRFASAYHLQFPLGSDPDLEIAKKYDAVKFGIRRLRVTYVIDREGLIRGVVHHEVLVSRHWNTVVKILRQLH